MKLRRELTYFDVTNIVIGSVIGADIYIVSAIAAGLVGAFSIIVWLIASLFAIIIALVFAHCSMYCPRVGGPFAYVSKGLDDFYGFLAGWGMWIAEMLTLAVFPLVFVNYLRFFIPLDFFQQTIIKGLLISCLTVVNIFGVKKAGILNDILTIFKLLPLLLLIVLGLFYISSNTSVFVSNYSTILPLGLENFGRALILIFWAYAGFEFATLPATEIKNPRRTIPRAMVTGMLIVTLFYMLTNFAVYSTVNWQTLKNTNVPLVLSGMILMGGVGAIIMTVGALLSVSGSDESNILGTARLSYAMSIDGLFPKVFSKIHPRYKTPYIALIIQAVFAFAASAYAGVTDLISFSMFNLSFSYLLTCLALVALRRKERMNMTGENVLPWLGLAICLYLLYSSTLTEKIIGSIVILVGIPFYVFLSPKVDIHHLKRMFLSEEMVIERKIAMKERFLANLVRHTHKIYKRLASFR
jgi:amino acid transporter